MENALCVFIKRERNYRVDRQTKRNRGAAFSPKPHGGGGLQVSIIVVIQSSSS